MRRAPPLGMHDADLGSGTLRGRARLLAQFAGGLEGHPLLDGLDFLDVAEAERGELAEDALD